MVRSGFFIALSIEYSRVKPDDFMFQLNAMEFANWKSQNVTSDPGAVMGLRKQPYDFT